MSGSVLARGRGAKTIGSWNMFRAWARFRVVLGLCRNEGLVKGHASGLGRVKGCLPRGSAQEGQHILSAPREESPRYGSCLLSCLYIAGYG